MTSTRTGRSRDSCGIVEPPRELNYSATSKGSSQPCGAPGISRLPDNYVGETPGYDQVSVGSGVSEVKLLLRKVEVQRTQCGALTHPPGPCTLVTLH